MTYPLKGWAPPEVLFQVDPLAVFFVSISERMILPGFWFCLLLLLCTGIFGRFFCGWVCPLGTFSDWLSVFNRKRNIFSDTSNSKIRIIKYVIIALLALAAFLGLQLIWLLDPLVIIARFLSLNFIPAFVWILNQSFIFLIQSVGRHYTFIYDFYRAAKHSWMGINTYTFENSIIILISFLLVIGLGFIVRRLWCRMLCPLGALYAFTSKKALLERTVSNECNHCLKCRVRCRMGAIREDTSTIKGECILCMDCVYACSQKGNTFSWRLAGSDQFNKRSSAAESVGPQISRKEFLLWILSALGVFGFSKIKKINHGLPAAGVIRPPGALKEKAFIDRCIRCGNCMKVCMTNGLQPVMFEAGLEGIWTPRLVPEIGYCEYQCNLCGNVCPTQAIPRLSVEEKKRVKLGVAEIDRSRCIAWAENRDCIVCEEHCPIEDKAIKTVRSGGPSSVLKPVITTSLCIGCGICQNVCPARPRRAIEVNSMYSQRT